MHPNTKSARATKYFSRPETAYPFNIEMAGTSYCDGSYRIVRTLPQSNVYVLEYILEGEGTIRVNGKEYHPREGDFYLLHSGVPHEYYSSAENPWIKVFMNVYGLLCDKVVEAYGLGCTILVPGCNVQPLFRQFLESAKRPGADDADIFNHCAGIFVEILGEVHRHLGAGSLSQNMEALKLRQYLDASNHRFVSIGELAESIYRSKDFATKLFKAEFGTTPYEYQINQKMEICRRLLCTTNMPICAIAESTGYTDQQYFSRLFKARCGMSPRKYRDAYRQSA